MTEMEPLRRDRSRLLRRSWTESPELQDRQGVVQETQDLLERLDPQDPEVHSSFCWTEAMIRLHPRFRKRSSIVAGFKNLD